MHDMKVDRTGIEPVLPRCKLGVLPLSLTARVNRRSAHAQRLLLWVKTCHLVLQSEVFRPAFRLHGGALSVLEPEPRFQLGPTAWKAVVLSADTTQARWSIRRATIPVPDVGNVVCCRVHLGCKWRSMNESNALLPGWSRFGHHDLSCVMGRGAPPAPRPTAGPKTTLYK